MRRKLVIWMFEHSQRIYTRFFKRKHIPWGISTEMLLAYPTNSFGYHLGDFLNQNGFELISKVERHDAYHVLTQFGTEVEDEIALQFLCMGNGKKSMYMYGAIILGALILPEFYKYYQLSYHIGKEANTFHQFEYKHLLKLDYDFFRSAIFSKELEAIQHTKLQELKERYQNIPSLNTI